MFGKIVGSLVSLLLVVGVIAGVVVVLKTNNTTAESQNSVSASMKMVTTICEPTTYKEVCAKTLEPAAKNSSATLKDYILTVVEATLNELNKSLEATGKIKVDKSDQYNFMAVDNCKELLDDSIQTLQASFSMVGDSELHTLKDRAHELLSWMTGVWALESSCLDQFEKEEYKTPMTNGMLNATQLTHNAVNIMADLETLLKAFTTVQIPQIPQTKNSTSRRLMGTNKIDDEGFPTWVPAADRRLLWRAANIRPHAVVSKAGPFRTINQALASYPKNHRGRFIIYVKAGVYDEQVIVDKNMLDVFMYGDGMGKTIVTGRKNFAKMKIGTMNTATFAAVGAGFIAQGMTFRNEAGVEGHQAVAFRSQADRTVMFDCSFEGNQDTLYYQAHRQFYKNCHIYGTLDFIFGMGDVVIQDSQIIVRRPGPGQSNTVTADGKSIQRSSGGLVLQNCVIVPDRFLFPLRFQIATYLGRPWKAYALTVTMQSELGDFIRPEGYMLWQGENNQKTCEMYEFANRGPGARTDRRDKAFSRFKVLSAPEAARFAPGVFIDGNSWLRQTGVPAKLTL